MGVPLHFGNLKVNKFEIPFVLVVENVFRLDVSMADSLVVEVNQAVEQRLDNLCSNFFIEGTFLFDATFFGKNILFEGWILAQLANHVAG